MNYAVHLASVTGDAIDRCRATGTTEVPASRVAACPHDLVNLEVQPLGAVLAELLDVGQPLRNDGWHPLRAPVVVDAETVMARAQRLEEAWRAAEPEIGGLMGDVIGGDIDAVRSLYAHASAHHEWVLSYLSEPEDPSIASRTLLPSTVAAPDRARSVD